MKNCLVLGSGRSGTSMAAGLFSSSGYFMGENLIPPRPANPKGFFETSKINLDINERLLMKISPKMKKGRYWLAEYPIDCVIPKDKIAIQNIKILIKNAPFCYKDPRFSYTFPIWYPLLSNTKFLCVFRHPASTANSIIKECNTAPYLRTFNVDLKRALRIYKFNYLQILEKHRKFGDWIFVHYNQLFERDTIEKLEEFFEVKLNENFPEKALVKPIPNSKIPGHVFNIYKRLCKLAKYDCV